MNFITTNLVLIVVIAVIVVPALMAVAISYYVPTLKKTIYRWPPVWRVVRIFVLFVIVDVLIVLIYLSYAYSGSATTLLLAYIASLIGAVVGAGELIARYRDAPFSALGRRPSSVYLAVNAIAAGTAFLLINGFNWTFGFSGEGDTSLNAIRVLVAGFGAMALFRSSLFLARVGDKDVGVGPATILQVVLNAADAGVDRETAKTRAPAVKSIMENVDPNKAKILLPLFCHRLLQSSLPEDEFIAMKNKINQGYDLDSNQEVEVTERSKAYTLGLIIMNYMGEDVLRCAVETLGPEITVSNRLHLPNGGMKNPADTKGVAVEHEVGTTGSEDSPIKPENPGH